MTRQLLIVIGAALTVTVGVVVWKHVYSPTLSAPLQSASISGILDSQDIAAVNDAAKGVCPETKITGVTFYDAPDLSSGKIGVRVENEQPATGSGISYIAVRLQCDSVYGGKIVSYTSLSGSEPSLHAILSAREEKLFLVDQPYRSVLASCKPTIVQCSFPLTE